MRAAFKEPGYADFVSIETMQFIPGRTSFYAAGIELDIVTEMRGLEAYFFKECSEMALRSDLDGVIVPFLHINHLIEKKAVNRPKVQAEVIYLEKIKKIRKKEAIKKTGQDQAK